MYDLSFNGAGDLVLTLNLGLSSHNLRLAYFDVNTQTLIPARIPTRSAHALAVPWGVQRQALVSMVAATFPKDVLLAHACDIAKVTLIIDRDGDVTEANAIGVPKEVAATLIASLKRWKFKPTVLDGAPVAVSTEFTTEVAKIDDSGKNAVTR